MGLKAENIELQNKIVEGVNRAYKKLLLESAEKNQSLVVADKQGNIRQVPAKDLLKKLSELQS